MGKPAERVELATEERREIEGLLRRHETGQAPVRRARIALATTLFAAPDMATGKVIGRCLARPRAREFPKFLARRP